MRVNGQVSYEIEHGEGVAGLKSVWSVPYSVDFYQGNVREVEENGKPSLESVKLKLGPVERELEIESGEEAQWQVAYAKAHKYIESELQDLFVQDAELRFYESRVAA